MAASRRRLLPAIHLAPESAFQGPPGHISSRGGADLCPSSVSNPSRQPSRAHSLARWFSEAGMTVLTLFAFRFGRMVRWLAGREAEGPWCGAGRGVTRGWRWFGVDLALIWRHRGDGYFLQFTWHPNRPSRPLQGTSARAMASICVHRASRTPPDSVLEHIRLRDD